MEANNRNPSDRDPAHEGEERGITSPAPEDENQSTTPPGNPPVDEQATQTARDKLDQAGGGH